MFGEAYCEWETTVVFYYLKFRLSIWLFTYKEKHPAFKAMWHAGCLMPKKKKKSTGLPLPRLFDLKVFLTWLAVCLSFTWGSESPESRICVFMLSAFRWINQFWHKLHSPPSIIASSQCLTLAVLTFSKITANTDLGNTEPLFLGEIGD